MCVCIPRSTVSQNVVLLRRELVSLYTTDAIRRVITETALPLGIQCVKDVIKLFKATPKASSIKQFKHEFWTEDAQVGREEHELFDEYLEMVC